MGVRVAELQILISGDARGAQQELRGVENAIRKVLSLGGALGGIAKAVGSVVSGLGKIGFAAMGLGAIQSAAGGLVSNLFGMNVSMENARAQLTAFTGSAEEAGQILGWVRQEAAKTPFAFTDMVKATTMLIPAAKGAGVQFTDLIKRAEVLAALNPQEGLVGAAYAIREALSGDFVSLVERFNLPRQYINQLKEQGVPAIEIIDKALQRMGATTDLVGLLAQTASGRWSTFKDVLSQVKATAFEALFQQLSGTLGQVTEWLVQAQPRIEAFASSVGAKLASAFAKLVQVVRTVAPVVREAITQFAAGFRGEQVESFAGRVGSALGRVVTFLTGTVVPAVRQAASDFVAGFRGEAIESFAGRMGAAFQRAVQFLTGTAIPAIRQAFSQFMSGFQTGEGEGFAANLGKGVRNLVAAVQSALPALMQFGSFITGTLIPSLSNLAAQMLPKLQPVFGFLSSSLPTLVPLLAQFGAAFVGLSTASGALSTLIGPLTSILGLVRGFTSLGGIIGGIVGLLGGPLTVALLGLAAVIALVATAWQQNWFNIRQHVATAVQAISSAVSGMGAAFSGIASSIMAIVTPIIAAVTGLFSQILSSWQQWAQQIAPVAQQALANITGAIMGIVNVIMSVVTTVGQIMFQLISTVLNAIVTFVMQNQSMLLQIFSGLWQMLSGLIMMLSGILQGLLTMLIGFFAGDWGKVWEGAKKVVQSTWNGIIRIISGALTMIRALVTILLTAILTIIASGFEKIQRIARETWEAFVRAIREKIGDAVAAVRALVSAVIDALRSIVEKAREIGRAMVDGLVSAIRAGASAVGEAIRSIVQDAIASVKQMLGIKSPSRVTHEIGSMMMLGLMRGINEGGSTVVAMATRVASALRDALATAQPPDFDWPTAHVRTGLRASAGTSGGLQPMGGELGGGLLLTPDGYVALDEGAPWGGRRQRSGVPREWLVRYGAF